jgi:hypothetical protein
MACRDHAQPVVQGAEDHDRSVDPVRGSTDEVAADVQGQPAAVAPAVLAGGAAYPGSEAQRGEARVVRPRERVDPEQAAVGPMASVSPVRMLAWGGAGPDSAAAAAWALREAMAPRDQQLAAARKAQGPRANEHCPGRTALAGAILEVWRPLAGVVPRVQRAGAGSMVLPVWTWAR